MSEKSYIVDDFNRFGGSFDVILEAYEERGWMTSDEAAKMLLTEAEYESWLESGDPVLV